jgi:hypothetical protein
MHRRNMIQTSALTALALALPLRNAVAQTKSIKDQLVGTLPVNHSRCPLRALEALPRSKPNLS